MGVNVTEYINCPRDSKRERGFARQLRQLPEDECFRVVQELLEHSVIQGLHIAHSTLQTPRYFQALLEQGLKQADASSINLWLECVVPKLGFRRVVSTLSHKTDTDLAAVDQALYWMPRFKPEEPVDGASSAQALQALREAVNRRRNDVEVVEAAQHD